MKRNLMNLPKTKVPQNISTPRETTRHTARRIRRIPRLGGLCLALGAATPLVVAGCNDSSGGPNPVPTGTPGGTPRPTNTPANSVVTALFDFNAGTQDWTADVSDLPANYSSALYEISYGLAPLPSPLNTSHRALRLTSFNQSDDLWQFVKRPISGLRPNTLYRVRFEVELASNAPQNSGASAARRAPRST
jgi:hypothetical protein